VWSGQQVVAGAGSTLTWTLPAGAEALLVQPVLALQHGSDASVRFTAGDRGLGRVRVGAVGAQGDAASPVRLTPVALDPTATAGSSVVATVSGGSATLDALLVMPEIAQLQASGSTGAVVLLTSKSERRQLRRVSLPGSGRVQATAYDRNGRTVASGLVGNRALVEPGGFTLVFGAR
jgi:hypothetical protein